MTTNSIKDQLFKYMAEKESLEKKISDFGEILDKNGRVGMYGPLIDTEGYPLSDIDIYQVRMARHQIICLQNDHKELMKKIEHLMHQLHAESRNETQNEHLANNLKELENQKNNSNQNVESLHPIAKVNFVSESSPADDAGLQLGDEIIEFGTINSTNFRNDLNCIGNIVRHMENQKVNLKIKRKEQLLDLILIPKVWNGRGLLGCNIVLINAN